MLDSYIIIYLLYLIVLLAVSFYIYNLRTSIDDMHGMMVGMTLGMMAGLTVSTVFLIPTGNFLYGLIIGSVVGLLFGVPFGKLGGHLGIMEGVVAGPMGGMMGAMLGQMVRPFDIDVFIPFFSFVFLITMFGIVYAVNCKCCCGESKEQASNVSSKFVLLWILISVLLLFISIFLSFSFEDESSSNDLKLPPYLQELTKEDKKEAVMNGSYQEVDLYISSLRYSPNVIVAKKNIPLRINIYSDVTAGCGREIVFPDFNINKIVPFNGKEIVEFTPVKQGEFKFRCSMDMLRGKLIIV